MKNFSTKITVTKQDIEDLGETKSFIVSQIEGIENQKQLTEKEISQLAIEREKIKKEIEESEILLLATKEEIAREKCKSYKNIGDLLESNEKESHRIKMDLENLTTELEALTIERDKIEAETCERKKELGVLEKDIENKNALIDTQSRKIKGDDVEIMKIIKDRDAAKTSFDQYKRLEQEKKSVVESLCSQITGLEKKVVATKEYILSLSLLVEERSSENQTIKNKLNVVRAEYEDISKKLSVLLSEQETKEKWLISKENDLNLKILQVQKYKTKIERMVDKPIPDLSFE